MSLLRKFRRKWSGGNKAGCGKAGNRLSPTVGQRLLVEPLERRLLLSNGPFTTLANDLDGKVAAIESGVHNAISGLELASLRRLATQRTQRGPEFPFERGERDPERALRFRRIQADQQCAERPANRPVRRPGK